jgi:co-chaperonin GroES (HSP10)
MSKSIQIVGDRILALPNQLKKAVEVKKDDGTTALILIEHGEGEKRIEAATTEGVVYQIGPTAYSGEPAPWVKVGDKVQWGKYAGYWITDPETKENYVILDPHDILCVITYTGEAK